MYDYIDVVKNAGAQDPFFAYQGEFVFLAAVLSTRHADARVVSNHHLYRRRQGRADLLGRRQQGRRRLRGFLRRELGRRDQREGRKRDHPPGPQRGVDRQRQRRHRAHGRRGFKSPRPGSGGVRRPRVRPPPAPVPSTAAPPPPPPRRAPCSAFRPSTGLSRPAWSRTSASPAGPPTSDPPGGPRGSPRGPTCTATT